MERGESSNLEFKYKYSRRPKTGIVIQEANSSVNTTADGSNSEQSSRSDQYMPIANVTRIMRRILPHHAKISDDAKEAIQECVTEFISFITSEANAKCNQEFRKTVTPEDVLKAMGTLGFDNYAEALTVFLNKHRAQDPDRGPVQQLQFVKCESPNIVQCDPASIVQCPMGQRPGPTPDVMPSPYVPLPPAYDGANYSMYPAMNNYFMGSMRGNGEGCSKDMEEFDPFK